MNTPKLRLNAGFEGEEGVMAALELSPPQTRAQDEAFVRQCSLNGLRPQLPLCWPTPADAPPSPKKRYRSHYVYLGFDDLDDPATWKELSAFDLVLRLVDFSPLRPMLAQLLGWISARGWCPFDPISLFLLIGWQLVNNWTRAQTLRHLRQRRYADYAQRFGFEGGVFPTEGGVRYFLTTIGRNSETHDDTVTVELDDDQWIEIGVQYLNRLIAATVTLMRQAHLVTDEAWTKALLCPDGMIHDAASNMRCTAVQDSCYQPIPDKQPRPCPAKEKGNRGCDCDTLRCLQVCQYAPSRDPQARCVYYSGSNQPTDHDPNASATPSSHQEKRGDLRYGYRSLTLQFAEPTRRFSLVLMDDLLSANEREENPSAALLLQLKTFYPDLGLDVVAGDAGLGYYAFLHAAYQLGAKRAVDLRFHSTDKDKSQWTTRGYDDKGRPVCFFGYRFTANGFDATCHRHKWFCGQACLRGVMPVVQLPDTLYPPDECPYQHPNHPHGKIVNVRETFKDGSIRLARDIPVGTPTWKRFYRRARNASEDRNSDLECWGLKRLPVYGKPRGRALIALADVWLNLTTLARLVHEATAAARTTSG
jgi:hypothetical protein